MRSDFTFSKGDYVEVSKGDHPNRFYPALVLRGPEKHKNLVYLEYQTLFVPSSDDNSRTQKRLREYMNVANVRPKLPIMINSRFKVGDVVDAFRDAPRGAWCIATVTDILVNSRYAVWFHEEDNECAVVQSCSLRIHRKWVKGEWVPSLPYQEQPPRTISKPRNIRFKIKYSGRPQQDSKFTKGRIVEVSSDDEGYKGAWFVATIVDLIGEDRFIVEYRDLTTDDGSQLLREETHAKFIRPCPPDVRSLVSFRQFQEVDAWYNDGWWEGMVVEVVNSRECLVSFTNNDVLKVENSKLRPHQDWCNGKWVMSSKTSSELAKKFGEAVSNKLLLKCQNSSELAKKPDMVSKAKDHTRIKLVLKYQNSTELAKRTRDEMSGTNNTRCESVLHLCKGAKVEVRSDEEGYEGAWYTAIIVDSLRNGKYLVEYLTLKTEDLTEQLKEEAHASDIRPFPPDMNHPPHFALREWVDVWYNDGWWVGQVSCILLHGSKYMVYFRTTNEELEFKHCDLRPHQEWFDGRWLR